MTGNLQTEKVTALLADAASRETFSAAQAAFGHPGGPLTTISVGRSVNGPADDHTLFDIASLTKLFIATACLRMVADAALRLDDRLDRILSEAAGSPAGAATLEQLLAHEAGLIAWRPLFESIPMGERGTPKGREGIVAAALESPLEAPPGARAVYSDLGYILLGRALERIAERPLDEVIYQRVANPLSLESVRYRRNRGGGRENIAPTERCPWRGRVLAGEVHDDNAWTMGGVAGHAGLFATARDVAAFGQVWLECLDGTGWLPQNLAIQSVTRRPHGRGLGWDLKSPTGSSCGERFPANAFGHLGFTGCSLWIDPERRLSVALMTNRVHFGRENPKIRAFRPRFHDALFEVLETEG